jgi:hypothetical protein
MGHNINLRRFVALTNCKRSSRNEELGHGGHFPVSGSGIVGIGSSHLLMDGGHQLLLLMVVVLVMVVGVLVHCDRLMLLLLLVVVVVMEREGGGVDGANVGQELPQGDAVGRR